MEYRNSPAGLLAEATAQLKVAELSQRGDVLLAQIKGADSPTREALRCEATRLFGICFEITRRLSVGDVSGAHRIGAGDADQHGDVLGMAG